VTKDHDRAPRLSAGVVVVRQQDGAWRYLLLRAFRHWDFPKGAVEAGERPRNAAVREVAEETGLAALEFRWGDAFCETEPYGRGKVARYYVADSPAGDVHLLVSPELGRPEHHEYRWLGYRAARVLLVPRVARVLDWAEAIVTASR
jgi:8-oxo-dGTP pyrophosphatase MutT (NUDIX family)